jgi:hypothetical protein
LERCFRSSMPDKCRIKDFSSDNRLSDNGP